MTHSDKAPTAEQLAIIQTSEAAASWIEGRALPSTVTQRLAELYRGGDHLKGQTQ